MYKVLIVDDEALIRDGLKYIMDWEAAGFSVCGEASNGEEALRLIFSMHPDFREAYGLLLVVYSSDDSLTDELKYLLSVMIPENIVTDIVYETVTGRKEIYLGTVLEQADILEIRQR